MKMPRLGTMVHTYNAGTWETKARELWVEATLSCRERTHQRREAVKEWDSWTPHGVDGLVCQQLTFRWDGGDKLKLGLKYLLVRGRAPAVAFASVGSCSLPAECAFPCLTKRFVLKCVWKKQEGGWISLFQAFVMFHKKGWWMQHLLSFCFLTHSSFGNGQQEAMWRLRTTYE